MSWLNEMKEKRWIFQEEGVEGGGELNRKKQKEEKIGSKQQRERGLESKRKEDNIEWRVLVREYNATQDRGVGQECAE